jgi:hypothetical protein
VSPARAQGTVVEVKNVTADWVDGEMRVLIIFKQPLPPSLEDAAKRPSNYSVTENAPNPNGNTTGATTPRNIRIRRLELDSGKTLVTLFLLGPMVPEGKATVADVTVGSDSIRGGTFDWIVATPYPSLPFSYDINPSFQGSAAVLSFNVTKSTAFRWKFNQENVPVSVTRDFISIEGVVPVTTPGDVEDAGGDAHDEATGDVANYVEATYKHRGFSGRRITSLGVVARANGRLKNPEVVGQWQPFAGFLGTDFGRMFAGAELEAGWRDGTEEWVNLSENAPDRGNVVARLGGVLEYAPQFGKVNQDMGSGLRFFVRGRGWADYAKDDESDNGVRFRGFLDSEFFYNINARFRVYARYELGYLPPDLSRRRNGFGIGVGASF